MFFALLIGRGAGLLLHLPHLLNRVGFQIDVIGSCPIMRHSRFIRNYVDVPWSHSLIPAIRQQLKNRYDWIIACEDGILSEILTSNLSLEEKLKILPVTGTDHFYHLFSKIGLHKAFLKHGIKTPVSFIVHSKAELMSKSQTLDYPLFLKQDASSGGQGVRECHGIGDVDLIEESFFAQPILVQKKIFGETLDLSGIFLEGQLVHFSYARQDKVVYRHLGPSCLRTYSPLSSIEKECFEALTQIGKALGVHGFTNITCIRQANGEYYFFEVDLRPNVWVDYAKYFGEDPAERIRQWFLERKTLTYPVNSKDSSCDKVVLPYFLRLKLWELLFNRYKVWRYLPWKEWRILLRLIVRGKMAAPCKKFLREAVLWRRKELSM